MNPRTGVLVASFLVACGSSSGDGKHAGGGGTTAGGGAAGSAGASGGAAGSGGSAGASGGTTASGGNAGASGGSAGASGGAAGSGGSAADPTQDGPFTHTAFDATATVSATGDSVPMHCVVPSGGPDPAPYPVVIIAHGFQLPVTQYYGYAERLGSFGYIACTADYPAGLVTPNHAKNAKDLSGALDWILVASVSAGSPLDAKVNGDLVGVMGHSLGGKLSVLAAAADARFKAVLGLDPVDTSTFCNPTDCPDASSKLPLPIPTAFLGETTDSAGGFQPCAPAADNYQTFYAAAGSPSVEVTLNGANHMSFIDDPSSCGLTCSFCQPATMTQANALLVSRAYAVSFFERRLRGRTQYDAWLTGANAQASFVGPGLVSLQSK